MVSRISRPPYPRMKLITSKVANWYNADTLTASPSQINFLVFIPIFSFITVAYLEITPRYAKRGKRRSAFFKKDHINHSSIAPICALRPRDSQCSLLFLWLYRARRFPLKTPLLPWLSLRLGPYRLYYRSHQLRNLDCDDGLTRH